MSEKERPKVGVGVIILRNGKILLGKRKNAHGNHTWNFPGGHLEFNEEIIDCARREVLEETGLKIVNPKIVEPNKCDEWNWFEWTDLPQPLFLPIQNLLKQKFVPII